MSFRSEPVGRRRFLGAGIGIVAGTAGLDLFQPPACPAILPTDALIAEIERDVIFQAARGA